jgi:hypothetical protein
MAHSLFLHFLGSVGQTLAALPPVFLAALVFIVPIASAYMRRSFVFQYGILELIVAFVFGFAVSMGITEARGRNDIALWVAFLLAMYIGSRGLHDTFEGGKRRSHH